MADQRTPRRPVPPPFPFGPPARAVPPPEQNQGEGDRASARRYNRHVEEFVDSGQVDLAAQDAAEAVSGPEGDWLRKAEAEGKARGRVGALDKLRGMLRRVFRGPRSRGRHAV